MVVGLSLQFPYILIQNQASTLGLVWGLDDYAALFGKVKQVSISSNYVVDNNIIFYAKDTKTILNGGTEYYIISENNIIGLEAAL